MDHDQVVSFFDHAGPGHEHDVIAVFDLSVLATPLTNLAAKRKRILNLGCLNRFDSPKQILAANRFG